MNSSVTETPPSLAGSKIPFTMIIASLVVLLPALTYLLRTKMDPHEPPVVYSSIPFIGHAIGMYRHGWKYFQRTASQTDAPIHTLPILNGCMYVATGRDLISQIARNSKTLSFDPFIAPMAARVASASKHSSEVLEDSLDSSKGSGGYYPELMVRVRANLAAGEGLDLLERRMFGMVANKLATVPAEGEVVDFFVWVRRLMNECQLTTLYGSKSPYHSYPTAEEDLLQFEHGLNRIILGSAAPWLLARGPYLARERLVKAMTEYFGGSDGKSPPADMHPLIRARFEQGIKSGLSVPEVARFEVTLAFAITENTPPATFYMLVRMYHTPGLLADIRAELQGALEEVAPQWKVGDAIPLTFLKGLGKRCPLLRSTWDEVLRVHSFTNTMRIVVEDTWLKGNTGEYLVKKGKTLFMPNSVLHSNPTVFKDPGVFNPRRFMTENSKPAELRPWGGGATICPGRFFATSETLAVAALLAMCFDLECLDAAGGQAKWFVPENYQHTVAAGIWPPKDDLKIKITPRSKWVTKVSFD